MQAALPSTRKGAEQAQGAQDLCWNLGQTLPEASHHRDYAVALQQYVLQSSVSRQRWQPITRR
jgi:hypothetical protein